MMHFSLIKVLMVALVLTEVKFTAIADKTCSDGNLLIEDTCYDPHFERPTTFENAIEICEEDGGQVALVQNSELQNSLARIALKQKFDNYWIQTDSKLIRSESCHTIMSKNNFEVSEEHCNNAMFYICEFDFQVSNSSKYGNKYFQLSEDRRKLTDAIRACSNLGGKLAQVDEQELNFLAQNLKTDQTWERFSNWQLDNLHFGYYQNIWNGANIRKGSAPISNSVREETKSGKCERFSLNSVELGDCDDSNFFVCQFTAETSLPSPFAVPMEFTPLTSILTISLIVIIYKVFAFTVDKTSEKQKKARQVSPAYVMATCNNPGLVN